MLPLTPTALETHTTITFSSASFAAQLESAATFWKDIELRRRKHTADFLGVCSLRESKFINIRCSTLKIYLHFFAMH